MIVLIRNRGLQPRSQTLRTISVKQPHPLAYPRPLAALTTTVELNSGIHLQSLEYLVFLQKKFADSWSQGLRDLNSSTSSFGKIPSSELLITSNRNWSVWFNVEIDLLREASECMGAPRGTPRAWMLPSEKPSKLLPSRTTQDSEPRQAECLAWATVPHSR